MIRWIMNLFRSNSRMSNQWLYEHESREANEGWRDAPRWRFPAEIAEINRLERKRKISLIRAQREENQNRA